MRKKYLSALLFGALLVTSAGTFTSCKDYDDDIKNLQEQVDGIKNDENTVTTEELNSAIEAAKTDLNKQIAELQSKLESVEHPVSEDDIANLQGQIDDLKGKVEGLDDLKSRLSALEAANKLFLEGGDFSAYAGLDKFINDEIAAALKDDGAIYKYINNTVKNQILTEIKGGYEGSLKDLDNALKDLDSKYEALVGENGSIVSDINDLNLYMDAIKGALKGETDEAKRQELTELLQFVSDNKDALGSLLTGTLPENLKDDIKTIVSAELGTINSDIDAIESKMNQLGMDIEALKAMVKSIVFIPSYEDGKVIFSNIQFKNANDEYETRYLDNIQDIKFRISPASAVANLDEKYTITLFDDGAVASRAISEKYTIVKQDGKDYKVLENGVISVRLATNGDNEARALALALEPKAQENVKNDYDNITSDYFVAKTQIVKIDDVVRRMNADGTVETKTIYYNGTGDEQLADFSTAGWYVSLDGKDEYESIENYPLINTDDFVCEISIKNNDVDAFILDKGTEKVSLDSNIKDNINKTTDVYYHVTMEGYKFATGEDKVGTVEVKAKPVNIEGITITRNYSKNGNPYEVLNAEELATIIEQIGDNIPFETGNKLTLAYAGEKLPTIIDGVEGTGTVGVNSDFMPSNDRKQFVFVLPAGLKDGEKYTLPFTLTHKDGITINIPIKVIVPKIELEVELNKKLGMWEGDVATLIPQEPVGGSSTTQSFVFASMFDNLNDYIGELEQYCDNVEISSEAEEGYTGLTYSSDNIVLDFAKADVNKDFKMKITANVGVTPIEKVFTIKVADQGGKWQGASVTYEVEMQKQQNDILVSEYFTDAYKWTAKDGTVVFNKGVKDHYLKYTVTYVAEVNDDNAPYYNKYVNLDETTGKITIKGWNEEVQLVKPFEFKVRVKPTNRWGAIEGLSDENNYVIIKVNPQK